MSKERKLLKIVCFLYVLDALACLAFGGFTLAGMGLLDPADVVSVGGIDFNLQAWAVVFGIWGIASASSSRWSASCSASRSMALPPT